MLNSGATDLLGGGLAFLLLSCARTIGLVRAPAYGRRPFVLNSFLFSRSGELEGGTLYSGCEMRNVSCIVNVVGTAYDGYVVVDEFIYLEINLYILLGDGAHDC